MLVYTVVLKVKIWVLSLKLHSYFMYASSKALVDLGICVGGSELLLLDNFIKYRNLICWPINMYSKTCLKWPLQKRPKIGFQDQISLNASQKYCRMLQESILQFCLFVCLFVFVALRPMSTAMVIAGRSVHLTTLFSWAGLSKRFTSNLCTYFRL